MVAAAADRLAAAGRYLRVAWLVVAATAAARLELSVAAAAAARLELSVAS